MKSLLSIILLSCSLSAFAFPEEYYREEALAQIERAEIESKNVVVIVESLNLEATAANALQVCQNENLSRAIEFTASTNAQGTSALLLNVVCK